MYTPATKPNVQCSCGVMYQPLSNICYTAHYKKNWCPVTIKSSDWRKKTRELMARKWAEKPHEAEVFCMYERNRFESWVSNCPHSLTGTLQLPTVPQTNVEGMSQSAIFKIFITHTSVTLLSYFSIL
jgi:hypothetical protein